MPQMVLNITPELSNRINFWGNLGNETPEQLTLRLLEEYVSDCEIAEEISSEVHSGRMKVYPYEQVKRKLALAN